MIIKAYLIFFFFLQVSKKRSTFSLSSKTLTIWKYIALIRLPQNKHEDYISALKVNIDLVSTWHIYCDYIKRFTRVKLLLRMDDHITIRDAKVDWYWRTMQRRGSRGRECCKLRQERLMSSHRAVADVPRRSSWTPYILSPESWIYIRILLWCSYFGKTDVLY